MTAEFKQIFGVQYCPTRLELQVRAGRRYAARHHHKNIDCQTFGGAERPADAIDTPDIGDFMRIPNRRRRPTREYGLLEPVKRELERWREVAR